VTGIALDLWDVAGAAVLVLLVGALSVWLRLDLERKLLIASVRTVLQLTLLGYVLVPIFAAEQLWLTGVVGVGMVALAAFEAVRRSGRQYRGATAHAFGSLLLTGWATTIYATAALVQPDPVTSPQVVIPLLGMMLGNGLTGVSLGLDRALARLDEGRDTVELWLARGATWWEAARPVAQDAVRTGLIPILNSMSVVGLVTIPGMMTGQLLAGAPPEQAARYQILVMFLIAANTAAGVVAVVLLALWSLFDSDGRLRAERISGGR
jgi:putative ABC transport system permease protein